MTKIKKKTKTKQTHPKNPKKPKTQQNPKQTYQLVTQLCEELLRSSLLQLLFIKYNFWQPDIVPGSCFK